MRPAHPARRDRRRRAGGGRPHVGPGDDRRALHGRDLNATNTGVNHGSTVAPIVTPTPTPTPQQPSQPLPPGSNNSGSVLGSNTNVRICRVRRFGAVVGAPGTPTPRGRFAIYEIDRQPDPFGFLGPIALHLTAHSDVLDDYGGGPGRVALHGRGGASLLGPAGLGRLARLHPRRQRRGGVARAQGPARRARDHRLTPPRL
jgi:hypothetical protein